LRGWRPLAARRHRIAAKEDVGRLAVVDPIAIDRRALR
jgi:hypothetical protein